jgi:hypothetical protein
MTSQAFSKQVETLVGLAYPAMLGMTEEVFAESLAPLGRQAPLESEERTGHVPFVLVVNSPRAPISAMLPLAKRRGKVPVEKLYPRSPSEFTTIPNVTLPEGEAYLLVDVNRGAEYLNVTPDAALASMLEAGRSPLTLAEGVALLTHIPDLLQPNNCFSLLASRCGDKRVPALWLSEGRPKLGWCWAGNPHTWLGSATCAKRSGSVNLHASALGDALCLPNEHP